MADETDLLSAENVREFRERFPERVKQWERGILDDLDVLSLLWTGEVSRAGTLAD